MQDLQKQLEVAGYKGKHDLSSYIEACGEGVHLWEFNGGWYAQKPKPPTEMPALPPSDWEGAFTVSGIAGKTPSEAVANLYLKLNK